MASMDESTPHELRNFGLILGALFGAFFGVLPALLRGRIHRWPWAVAAALWLAALLYPLALKYLYAGWTRLGLALGWINTRIVLTLLFALSIVPTGLVMRMLGRDPMERRFEPERESYRRPSRTRSARSMERPY
jgi:hypothetical protein